MIFTDLVVETNKWPGDLIGQPGVHVARSIAGIMSLVEDILTGPNAVEELVAAVTER
ncbi:hypothetical protein [Actinophytocola sp.]|uniref:hypothetical protein n=1 Tax=Actinophytocola sp. TaxID=1872138 RepID=UPI002D29A359|nr:hypothetical protein [Actinophytocola sp.]HYQ68601.1 hypothetical protein [Actinophytocola sp.]